MAKDTACADFTERLLAEELNNDSDLAEHVGSCEHCSHLARGLERLDVVLAASLVVTPPVELQLRLAQIAIATARPQPRPWWQRLGEINVTEWLAQRPQLVAAQGLAAVMLVLTSWQVFGWLSAFRPVVGDVAYAMELVAGSPAVAYVGGLQIDLQSLGIWSLVGIAAWLFSEDGPIGRRIASTGLRLP
jgi:hypothetical protein